MKRLFVAMLCCGLSHIQAQAAYGEGGPSFQPTPRVKGIVPGTSRFWCEMRGPITVYVAPKQGSKIDYRYDQNAIMDYIGDIGKSKYGYVRPCNACNAGYVLKTEFKRLATCSR